MGVTQAEDQARIFISYRRQETAYPAGWLFDRLADHFGRDKVFKDVDSIQLGDDFAEVITAAVESCDVLLVLIGNQWLTITDERGQRRLDNPADFVRLEIEAALARNVRVIPILVEKAQMPRAGELPASLAKLVHRQALELSPSQFNFDIGRLLRVLDRTITEAKAQERVRQQEEARQEAQALVFGFALGPRTTVAVCRLPYEGAVLAAILDIPGSINRSITTAVAEHPARGILIGEEAEEARGVERLFAGFTGPDCDPAEMCHPITLFVQRLLQDLKDRDLIPRNRDVRYVFSVPNAWNSQRRRQYEMVLRSAGVTDVRVIPEWRATLLYCRHSPNMLLDAQLVSGAVLIVDVGALAVDLALIVRGQLQAHRSNDHLATRHLDTAIMDHVIARFPVPDVRQALQDLPDGDEEKEGLRRMCTRLKEDYIRADPADLAAGGRVAQMEEVSLGGDEYCDFVARLSADDMAEITNGPLQVLGGRSWRDVLQAELVTATLSESPDVVVLTGEAAHMRDVAEVVSEVFGTEKVRVPDDPEYVTARGLTLAYH